MALTPNSTFGIYQVGEVIGTGGMGEVFRATDTKLDRQVAIKALPDTFAEDADRIARFEREAKTLATLNHPNIAQIYGLETQGATTAIVMELVEGPTLADRIAQGPIPPEEALRIAKQLISGLEAAHDKGLVHRDLKPANIKIREDGQVKILDFGIAKPIERQGISGPGQTPTMITPAVTESGVIMGTAAYMSPEQARGKYVDQRTDIWAFGCVLYEMLTGQPLFAGEDVTSTLARVLEREVDMTILPGKVSPAVRHTLSLCLRKDPRKRISHISDVRLAMEEEFESPISWSATGQQAQPLWKRLVPVAAAVVVTAIGTSLFFLESPDDKPPAEVRRSMLTLGSDQSLNIPRVRAMDMAEDDSKMVYGANGALYVRSLDELEARILPGTEGENPITPNFSPDGKWIAYIQGTNGIKRVPVEGGTPLPVIPTFPNGGFSWIDDNDILYSNLDGIWRVTASGADPELLVNETSGYTTASPSMLPGGKYILYHRRTTDNSINEIAVAEVATGEITVLFPGFSPQYQPPGYLIYFDNSLGLMARTLDLDTLELGSPVALVNDIYRFMRNAGSPQYSISRNGSLLYVRGEVSDGGSDFLGIGNESQLLRQLNVPMNSYAWPSVSPDGTQVAVQSFSQIYIYALDGSSEIRQLTREGINVQPTWTPDGQYITYASDRDGVMHIWQQRADGSGVAEPLTEGVTDMPQTSPDWAPDGRLVFAAPNEGGGSDIWIVSIPLGEPELLIGGAGDQYPNGFSSDGRAIVYDTSEGGMNEVRVAPFPPDGSNTRVSQAGVSSGFSFWSRQGNTVYYTRAGGNGTPLISAVDIAVPGFAVTNRRDLPYLVVPDARRLDSIPGTNELFVAIDAAQNSPNVNQASSTELIFVENWIEEVKQRAPRN